MSAEIIKFTGRWAGHCEPTAVSDISAQGNALHAAREIMAAKREGDNWVSVLLVGLLASMHKPDLLRLELAIGTHASCTNAASQALALVRLASGSKDHRERVRHALDVLQTREV